MPKTSAERSSVHAAPRAGAIDMPSGKLLSVAGSYTARCGPPAAPKPVNPIAAYTLSEYRLSSVPLSTERPSPFRVQASRSYDALSLSSTDTTPDSMSRSCTPLPALSGASMTSAR